MEDKDFDYFYTAVENGCFDCIFAWDLTTFLLRGDAEHKDMSVWQFILAHLNVALSMVREKTDDRDDQECEEERIGEFIKLIDPESGMEEVDAGVLDDLIEYLINADTAIEDEDVVDGLLRLLESTQGHESDSEGE